MVEQIEELTRLMNDLIELARGEQQPRRAPRTCAWTCSSSEVVERARRHAPATQFALDLEPTVVAGVPARLERAVSNLIDNAVKYSPPDEPVEIALRGDELTVRDHGPGISDADLPHVFDRFYRGAEARGRPGSGLGLAIVRQVAEQHGGSVAAEPAPGGGTLMRLRLPGAETLESPMRRTHRSRDAAGKRRGAARRRDGRAPSTGATSVAAHECAACALLGAKARRREPVAAAKGRAKCGAWR